jgi:hypothetical protein
MRTLLLGIALVACGCANLGGLMGGDAGTSATDGPAGDGPASDGGNSGPVNMLQDPGFEEGAGSACVGWIGNSGVVQRSSVARTGAFSCSICPVTATAIFFSLEDVPVDAGDGGAFHGEAWLRAPPAGPVAPLAGVQVDDLLEDGGLPVFSGTQIPPSSTWTISSVDFTVPAGGSLTFTVHGYLPDGGCVLVDDTALYQE